MSDTPTPYDWPENQLEALRRWQNKDPADRHPHDLLPTMQHDEEDDTESNRKAVTKEECTEMRRVFKSEDVTIKEMSEERFDYSRTTIAEHVFDRRCSHNIEETAAESPMDSIDPSKFITPDVCADLRECYHSGMQIPEIRDDTDLSYGQVYHHIAGRCRCTHDVPDKNGKASPQ